MSNNATYSQYNFAIVCFGIGLVIGLSTFMVIDLANGPLVNVKINPYESYENEWAHEDENDIRLNVLIPDTCEFRPSIQGQGGTKDAFGIWHNNVETVNVYRETEVFCEGEDGYGGKKQQEEPQFYSHLLYVGKSSDNIKNVTVTESRILASNRASYSCGDAVFKYSFDNSDPRIIVGATNTYCDDPDSSHINYSIEYEKIGIDRSTQVYKVNTGNEEKEECSLTADRKFALLGRDYSIRKYFDLTIDVTPEKCTEWLK